MTTEPLWLLLDLISACAWCKWDLSGQHDGWLMLKVHDCCAEGFLSILEHFTTMIFCCLTYQSNGKRPLVSVQRVFAYGLGTSPQTYCSSTLWYNLWWCLSLWRLGLASSADPALVWISLSVGVYFQLNTSIYLRVCTNTCTEEQIIGFIADSRTCKGGPLSSLIHAGLSFCNAPLQSKQGGRIV